MTRRSSVGWRWLTVWRPLLCVRGHEIPAGRAALFSRVGPLRVVRCIACAKQDLGWDPPPTDADEALADFKMRQAGDAS